MVGTPLYMAPEIITLGEDGYGTKADIWSLGITVGELLDQGNTPWPEFSNPGAAFMHIAAPDSLPQIPEYISPLATDFIKQCCQRASADRPSAAQLMKHPWLNSVEE